MESISDAELSQMAARIDDLERQRMAHLAEAGRLIVEMGQMLSRIKLSLGHGRWLEWAQANLPFSTSTADNYMKVAANSEAFPNLLSLDRSQLYELAEIAEKHPEVLQGLTPDTVIGGKKLSELGVRQIKKALLPVAAPAATAPQAPDPWEHLYALARIRQNAPATWADIVDDIARLIQPDSAPAPAQPVGTLMGATRDERAAETHAALQKGIDMLDDIDDVPGALNPVLKHGLASLLMRGWREVNLLPADPLPPHTQDGGYAPLS